MRKHLVALFVVFHVLAVVVLSIPPPLKGDTVDLDKDHRVAVWVDTLQAAGLPRSAILWTIREVIPRYAAGLRAVKRPFVRYVDTVGARQSWRMFGIVRDRRGQLEVDQRIGDAWVPVFRMTSADHDWQARLLRNERMRSEINLFAKRGHKSGFKRFAAHLASLAKEDGLPGTHLRVQMREVIIPPPAELRETGELRQGKVYWSVEHDL